jgi:molecular chaperone GrpE (heat shock protein)
MNKRLVIWSLVFMLAGLAGLAGVFLEKVREERRTASYKAKYGKKTDEYFDLDDGQGGVKTQEQLKQEQLVKLKADLADLAKGVKSPSIFADVLYGDNWHQEVSKYRKKMKLMRSIVFGSTVSILGGVLIGLMYHSQCVIPSVVRKFGCSRQVNKEVVKEERACENTEAETPARLNTDSNQRGRQTQSNESRYGDPAGYFHKPQHQKQAGSLKLKESLSSQAENFGKEAGQFEHSVVTGQIAKLMSTEPVSDSLSELTQEVSAIREFAAEQQDRVRQLQEGYDWTIIKRFCLRIIRCIDNLDDRISKLNGQSELTQYLEDVRDELVFALESSGVEQFEPRIDADYKGLEKAAEAVHERQRSDKARLSGKIAKVVRPGYRYVLNDNDVKIVRAAQVKLYL